MSRWNKKTSQWEEKFVPTGRTIIPELNLAPAPRLIGGKLVDSKFDVDYSRSSKTTAYSTSKTSSGYSDKRTSSKYVVDSNNSSNYIDSGTNYIDDSRNYIDDSRNYIDDSRNYVDDSRNYIDDPLNYIADKAISSGKVPTETKPTRELNLGPRPRLVGGKLIKPKFIDY